MIKRWFLRWVWRRARGACQGRGVERLSDAEVARMLNVPAEHPVYRAMREMMLRGVESARAQAEDASLAANGAQAAFYLGGAAHLEMALAVTENVRDKMDRMQDKGMRQG